MGIYIMKKYYLMFSILILLLTFGCFSNRSEMHSGPPEWYLNPRFDESIIEGMGAANNKRETILLALCDLAQQIDVRINNHIKQVIEESGLFLEETQRVNEINEVLSSQLFGKIEVQSIYKSFFEQIGQGEKAIQQSNNEFVGRLIYTDGEKKLRYSLIQSETGIGEEVENEYHIEFSERNCSMKDIISELKIEGYSIKEEYNTGQFYIGISIDAKKINKITEDAVVNRKK